MLHMRNDLFIENVTVFFEEKWYITFDGICLARAA